MPRRKQLSHRLKAVYLAIRKRRFAKTRRAAQSAQGYTRTTAPNVLGAVKIALQARLRAAFKGRPKAKTAPNETHVIIGKIAVQKRLLALTSAAVILLVSGLLIFAPEAHTAPEKQTAVVNPAFGPSGRSGGPLALAPPVPSPAPAGGQDDLSELDALVAGQKPIAPEDSHEDDYAQINPGTDDARVAWLQERLMDLDYMEPDEPTEFYGFQTKYAVQLFQREAGLQVDGIAGEETLRVLFTQDAKPYVVRKGDNGTDVTEMQKRLREMGYLKVKATGRFGDDTETAVKAFQKRNKLTVDGLIGIRTREALYSEKAIFAPVIKPSAAPKPGSSTPVKPVGKGVSAMITFAKKHLNKKYIRGAKGPNSFDCSGFVYYCLKNSGVKLGYMTSGGWAQSRYTKISSTSKIKAGDILCFRGHVGIYMGNGQMIDASSSRGKVRVTSINSPYWKRNFICARRVY